MKREIERFSKETVQIPTCMAVVSDGMLADSLAQISPCGVKLIMYFPSDRCTSCNIGRLENFEKVFDLRKAGQFYPMVIFAPKSQEYKVLIADLKLNPLPYPIFIDKQNELQRLNTNLPEDTRYHTFLLDKNNRIVLVGNPLVNDTMWNLFKSTLDNMLAHDGVYVPE